jgi:hypothetical protein
MLALAIAPLGNWSAAHAECGRGTLLQWSYGASFEGGPPSMDEPLVTDRPDFTESPVTVGVGVAQLEMGYTYTYDSGAAGSTQSHSYPGALLRVGMLAEWFELRIEWGYTNERENVFGGAADSTNGAEDLGLGCKIALTPQECMLPETGLILQMSLPTGSAADSADEVLPGFIYVYAWELNDDLSTAGQTQLNRALDGVTGEPYVEFSQSWTVGFSFTDRIGGYSEWFMFAPTGADTDHTEHYFDGGFTYLVNNNLQLDAEAGVGLNGAADDYFLGTGFAVRW